MSSSIGGGIDWDIVLYWFFYQGVLSPGGCVFLVAVAVGVGFLWGAHKMQGWERGEPWNATHSNTPSLPVEVEYVVTREEDADGGSRDQAEESSEHVGEGLRRESEEGDSNRGGKKKEK